MVLQNTKANARHAEISSSIPGFMRALLWIPNPLMKNFYKINLFLGNHNSGKETISEMPHKEKK